MRLKQNSGFFRSPERTKEVDGDGNRCSVIDKLSAAVVSQAVEAQSLGGNLKR